MGWTSTGDPYHSVGEAALKFDSKETAVEFAEKYGWQYTVSYIHFALFCDQTPLLGWMRYSILLKVPSRNVIKARNLKLDLAFI